MKIYNLTLHAPSTAMLDVAEITEPHGVVVATSDTPYDVVKKASQSVWNAQAANYKAILVGGMTDVAVYQVALAHKIGLTVYVAVTERKRDENDRFIFSFSGFREIIKLNNDIVNNA